MTFLADPRWNSWVYNYVIWSPFSTAVQTPEDYEGKYKAEVESSESGAAAAILEAWDNYVDSGGNAGGTVPAAPVVPDSGAITVELSPFFIAHPDTTTYSRTCVFNVRGSSSTVFHSFSTSAYYSAPPSLTVTIAESTSNYIRQMILDGYTPWLLVGNAGGTGSSANGYWISNLYFVKSGVQPTVINDLETGNGLNFPKDAYFTRYGVGPTRMTIYDDGTLSQAQLSFSYYGLGIGGDSWTIRSNKDTMYFAAIGASFSPGGGGGGGGAFGDDFDPDKDKPSTPDKPVIVTPTTPNLNTPTVNVTVNPVADSSWTEVIPYLKAILEALNRIQKTIADGVNAITGYLKSGFDYIGQYLSNISSVLLQMLDFLSDYLDWFDVFDYELNRLYEVLTGVLNQIYSGFDTVVDWLSRIYGKIGSGGGGTRPGVDPDDTSDLFTWLTDLWDDFFNNLLSVLPGGLAALLSEFADLQKLFPFSIPWDVFGMLSLLKHDPVVPVFDLPIPTGIGESGITTVPVDFTPWDGMVSGLRPLWLLLFAYGLAIMTTDLLAALSSLTKGD